MRYFIENSLPVNTILGVFSSVKFKWLLPTEVQINRKILPTFTNQYQLLG